MSDQGVRHLARSPTCSLETFSFGFSVGAAIGRGGWRSGIGDRMFVTRTPRGRRLCVHAMIGQGRVRACRNAYGGVRILLYLSVRSKRREARECLRATRAHAQAKGNDHYLSVNQVAVAHSRQACVATDRIAIVITLSSPEEIGVK